MPKCPTCHATVTFPDGAVRTVCPECHQKIRRTPKETAPDAGEVWAPAEAVPVAPPPKPRPRPPRPRSAPTTFVALAHFAFAPVVAWFGVMYLMAGEQRPQPKRPEEVKALLHFMLVASGLIVFAVFVVGAGVATWSRERSGYFLSLFVALLTGAAAVAVATFEHPLLWTLGFAIYPGAFYATFVLALSLLHAVRSDFFSLR